MTVKEMDNLFNMLYDNADQEAPGLNSFEKSQYLTKALFAIIKTTVEEYLRSGGSTGFRKDEINRYAFTGLIKSEVINTPIATTSLEKTTPNSEFFELPNDVYTILYEDCDIQSPGSHSLYFAGVLIQPTRYDFIQKIMRNPFRKPSNRKDRGYRLDVSTSSGTQLAEIIVEDGTKPINYRIRYVKSPEPIIIEDLTIAYPTLNLSIHGETLPYVDPAGTDSATNVNVDLHELIVQRAVELAIRGYRENTLQNNTAMESK